MKIHVNMITLKVPRTWLDTNFYATKSRSIKCIFLFPHVNFTTLSMRVGIDCSVLNRKWKNYIVVVVMLIRWVDWVIWMAFFLLSSTFLHRLILSASLFLAIFIAIIDAQHEIEVSKNYTEIQLECIVNNRTYTGNDCLESLNKFGRIVSYIVIGFLLIVFACCCGCWCCVCKVIHSKKNRSGGQVLSRPHNPVITTVA